jgi:hypothetical protein
MKYGQLLPNETPREACFRMVREAKEQMSPYRYELFLQRLERKLKVPAVKSKTVVDGCTVLQPSRWNGS